MKQATCPKCGSDNLYFSQLVAEYSRVVGITSDDDHVRTRYIVDFDSTSQGDFTKDQQVLCFDCDWMIEDPLYEIE